MKKFILSVNAGSSSIKLDAVDAENFEIVASGSKSLYGIDIPSAISAVMGEIESQVDLRSLVAVGHRVVHGGVNYNSPTLLGYEVVEDLKRAIKYAPEHMPVILKCIETFKSQFPNLAHVACFDTAFFSNLPDEAKILPIPRKYQENGLRRFGFHGLSYSNVLDQFRLIAGENAANGRVIIAHLGSGCSLTALYEGQPIDTSMGFSPTSGVIMSTRSGDIDPGVIGYLGSEYGLSISEIMRMLSSESGLLGISELSADMLTLLQNEQHDKKSKEAVNMFVLSILKTIGAYSALLGGLDSLIFTGGIGEKSSILRKRICANLGYLGIEINDQANEYGNDLISSSNSRVGVHVIKTKESVAVAKQTITLLGGING